MPELPEVETIKLGLEKKIKSLTLKKVEILNPKSFHGDPKDILNAKVLDVFRRAKILGINFANGLTILFHLKMSGQLIYQSKGAIFAGGHPTQDMAGEMPNKSTRVYFQFSDGSKLFFNDQRKFGWVKLFKTEELKELLLLTALGPEPLSKDFTWQQLKTRLLTHKSWPVKVAMMDQATVVGIGNIYAAEACFDAKIDPRVKVSTLSDSQFEKLHLGILRALKDGIKYGGSSRMHFVNSDGGKGNFLDYANVYGREKLPCNICGTTLEKIKLGGRGTVFCPKCQK